MSTEAPKSAFFWPGRNRSSWRLAAIIFFTLFLHAATFFLFTAAAPSINPPPRTAPAIQMLTPFGPDGQLSPENESLLRWIETEDPALVARIPNVAMPDKVDVPYRPSFATMRTAPLGLPAEAPTVLFPPARDAMTLIQSEQPSRHLPQAPLPAQATEVHFSTTLQARLKKAPKLHPTSRSEQLVQASQFLIGVTPDGETRFVFPQKSESGSSPALEQEAAAFLSSVRFEPTNGSILWGSVEVRWGDEVSAAP